MNYNTLTCLCRFHIFFHVSFFLKQTLTASPGRQLARWRRSVAMRQMAPVMSIAFFRAWSSASVLACWDCWSPSCGALQIKWKSILLQRISRQKKKVNYWMLYTKEVIKKYNFWVNWLPLRLTNDMTIGVSLPFTLTLSAVEPLL